MTNALTLLDCTLRDGGYYTNWDFAPELVTRYLQAAADAGIDYVEVGLRNFPKEGFAGPFAYSTEDYLERLTLPTGLHLGVMVDAKTLLGAAMDPATAVHALFHPAAESRVGLVRVAAHFSEVQDCAEIVTTLKDLGYLVGINLMQASGKPADAISSKLQQLLRGCQPDVLYYADSLGNMDAKEVTRLYEIFRSVWPGAIGIHTHNNKGLAVANSLHAIETGVSWIDATIQGMGRGAGNAEMEILLTEIGAHHGRRAEALYRLSMEDFARLRQQYQWGPSLMYYFSAKHDIHPTYAQELLNDDRYNSGEKVAIIQHLAEVSANSFSRDLYSTALVRHFADGVGSWTASNSFAEHPILLVAAGPTSLQYAGDLMAFAARKSAKIMTINTVAHINPDAIDGIVSVDQNRIRFEAAHWRQLNKPIFTPANCLPPDCTAELEGLVIWDFGLRVSDTDAAIGSTGCTLPFALSALYALALAFAGDAPHIYLAGFDGYGPGDPRQQEMIEGIEALRKIADVDHKVTAVTPTSYPFKQGSLYAP